MDLVFLRIVRPSSYSCCVFPFQNNQHSALLRSIQSLDGKKAPISQRTESAFQSEDYNNAGKAF